MTGRRASRPEPMGGTGGAPAISRVVTLFLGRKSSQRIHGGSAAPIATPSIHSRASTSSSHPWLESGADLEKSGPTVAGQQRAERPAEPEGDAYGTAALASPAAARHSRAVLPLHARVSLRPEKSLGSASS